MHPVQQPEQKQPESPLNFCSQISCFSAPWSQQTREMCSPILKSLESPTSVEYEFKLKSRNNRNKKSRSTIEEQEFKPNAPELKKNRKAPQNANRNVVPNIMHQVISFLQKKSKSEKIVEKLITKLQLNEVCSSRRFFFYQMLVKEKLNHYVNAQSLLILKEIQEPLCQVYSQEEQRHYNKISRLLIQYFLTHEFDTLILTSKRVGSDKKRDHLQTKRKILEQILKIFKE